jgi:uncharacterized protein (DUF58 family)
VNLTPLGIVLVGVAVAIGILGQWSPSLEGVPLWRVVVGFLVIGLAYELVVTRRIRLRADLRGAERLYLGRSASLDLTIDNSATRALAVQFAPVFPRAVSGNVTPATVRLPAAAARATAIAVMPIALGVHAWPPLPVRILGPLRLAWWSRSLTIGRDVRVVPDTLGARAVLAGSAEVGATAQPALGGARELHHLRNYMAGDPRHRIDWKASARASRLITRVFSEYQHL